MEPENRKLITPLGLAIDLALTGIFFLAFTFFFLPAHVPAHDPFWVFVWSALTAAPLTLVFFFAACYFRVTLIDFKRNAKAAKSA